MFHQAAVGVRQLGAGGVYGHCSGLKIRTLNLFGVQFEPAYLDTQVSGKQPDS